MESNRKYYDEFAATYEAHREAGYHALIDSLEVDLALRYTRQKTVLEAGCGTGLVLSRLAPSADRAVGVDLSPGMLKKARARGLDVVQGSVTQLPFASEKFDVVCSFKVLPHVLEINRALEEMQRVLKPGGHVIAEFYNPMSLRYLVKRLKRPTPVGKSTTDESIFTRYDSLAEVRRLLAVSQLELVEVRGVRVVTPVSFVHELPVLGSLFEWLEWQACDSKLLRNFGGFLVVVAQKKRSTH